ncbi:MAG: ABC transporter permease [Acidobacteria bacterium]|nr:ABC transporter permease [Acidobacteriota bacterium]
MLQFFRETVRYRELIWALALKDLRVRYKRSALGFFWALLHPLLMMVILTIVFSTVMRFNIDNYAVFLVVALLPWTFFSQSLSYSAESIVSNGELLKKLYIAKSVFPVSAVLANFINFVLSLIPLLLLLVVMRFPLHWTWIYLPVPTIGLIAFTLGFCFFCSAANVFFRDVAHIIQIVLSAWFYFSPIIYSLDFIPERFYIFFRLNPLVYILNGFRMAIYHGGLPTIQSAAMSLGCGFICFAIGYAIFRKYEDSFVYYL